MSNNAKSRSAVALVISGSVHVAFAVSLLAIPTVVQKRYDTVDMMVHEAMKKPETPPESEPEPEEKAPEPEPEEKAPEPEPEPKPKRKLEKRERIKEATPEEVEEPPPPPPEAPPPDVKEEAPPVFDLGDNTFALGNGQGASWNLKRSEGNTRFAGVAQKNQPSVRHTKPIVRKEGKPNGTGTKPANKPVPLRDLSRRPMPKRPVPSPPYPPEAKKAGIEGPVILKVYIDKAGKVRRIQVVQSPDALLAKAAQNAMGDISWTPPLDKSGNPVDTVIVWRFRFVLDG